MKIQMNKQTGTQNLTTNRRPEQNLTCKQEESRRSASQEPRGYKHLSTNEKNRLQLDREKMETNAGINKSNQTTNNNTNRRKPHEPSNET